MNSLPIVERVQTALSRMIPVERRIAACAEPWLELSERYEPARELVSATLQTTERHIDALHERLGDVQDGIPNEIEAPDDRSYAKQAPENGSIPGIFVELYSQLNSALIRYSALQPVSHRFRDSGVIAESGTTAHLTRAHMQDYMGLIGRITEGLHDAVIWEMDGESLVCDCTCPSCGLGLCVCSVASRSILSEAWAAAKPSVAETGLMVQLPRPGSSAEQAGFRKGDVVVAIDEQPVNSTSVVQKTIRDHRPNEPISFIVKRNSDLVSLTAERWSDLGVDADAVLDTCIVPASTEFFVDQARDAKERLGERLAGDAPLVAGLASLTPREIQVLRMVATGASNPLIAEDFEISRATVARHIANILEKLGAANRAEAASLATANGLVTSR